jgi:hypothetical protein
VRAHFNWVSLQDWRTTPREEIRMDFAERAGRNEDIFRQINQRIDEGAEQHHVASALPFHCECSDLTCTETIELDPATYDTIAANPLHFIVKPKHQVDEIEKIIAEHEAFYVVEKIGGARAEVEREHPRQRHRDT